MPQVMCPKCGTTINLENRKEIDFDLIKNATKKEPRTFTELLHITKLSRKTLSLRLKELCDTSIIVKNDRTYSLNGIFPSENTSSIRSSFVRDFTKNFNNRRIRTGIVLIAIALFSSTSGFVLATFLMPKQPEGPVVLGTFTMRLDINNVEDVCAWQTAITFNPNEITVLETLSGDFVGGEYPLFLNATEVADGLLLLGGTLMGTGPGKSGSGTLAIIVLGYYVNGYQEPRIAFNEKTFLLDSQDSEIPIGTSTLELATLTK